MTRRRGRISTTSAGEFTIPADGGDVAVPLTVDTFELDAGVTLALPAFEVGADRGLLVWELRGSETGALATINPRLTLVDTVTGVEISTLAQGDFGGLVFLSPGNTFFQDVPMSRGGEVGYVPAGVDRELFPAETALSADFEIPVSWIVYTPVDAEVPIDADVEVAVVE